MAGAAALRELELAAPLGAERATVAVQLSVPATPGTSRPSRVQRRERRRELGRAVLVHRTFSSFLLAALGFSLLGNDLWNLLAVPDHPGDGILDLLMAVVALLFLCEIALKLAVLGRQYLRSFFFWVDVLATLSVLLEVSAFEGQTRSMMVIGLSVSTRTPRQLAVRVVQRMIHAARLVKLLKVASYFKVGQSQLRGVRQELQEFVSHNILWSLSRRVPVLAVGLLVAIPLVSFHNYWYRPSHSMDVWVHWVEVEYARAYDALVNDPSLQETDIFLKTLEAMEKFYIDLPYHPYAISGFPEEVDVSGRKALIRAKSFGKQAPVRDDYAYVGQIQDCLVQRKECLFGQRPAIHFDMRSVVQGACWEHVFVVVLAIVVLLVVSLDLHKTLDAMLGIEKLAQLSRKLMAQTILDDAEIMNMSPEEKGAILEMMELEKRRSSVHLRREPTDRPQKATLVATSLPVGPEVIDSWELDLLGLEAEAQQKVIMFIFFDSRLGRATGRTWIDVETFDCFCGEVRGGYQASNAYHNYIHASDVCHTVYRLLCETRSDRWLSPVEQYALLVSALCHDIGHGGRTNPFLVEVSDELALRYNDTSPLENMHCARLFEICSRKATNVFKRLSREEFRVARKACIASILHTDMAHHFEMVKLVNMRYEMHRKLCDEQAASPTLLPEYQAEVLGKDPTLLLQLLLHLADVSNPLKPFPVCRAWAWLVLEEFFTQGDEEQRLGIPVGMLNDRNKVNKPGSQHGFIMFVVSPLVLGAASILHPLQPLASQMASNLGSWRELWLQTPGASPEEASKRAADAQKVSDEAERLAARSLGSQ